LKHFEVWTLKRKRPITRISSKPTTDSKILNGLQENKMSITLESMEEAVALRNQWHRLMPEKDERETGYASVIKGSGTHH